jgi:hypothetical protein
MSNKAGRSVPFPLLGDYAGLLIAVKSGLLGRFEGAPVKGFAATAMSIALMGCAAPPGLQSEPPVPIRGAFDEGLARKLVGEGVNTIRGNAFMRQRGGGVVTCAGSEVYLIPATQYAKERMAYLYGTQGESGSNSHRRQFSFNPDPPSYTAIVRTTRCDSQGNFVFDRVADGEFYVQTQVSWMAGSLQGGNLMHRVSVGGNQSISLVLSR